jgi:hypothetical protein
VLLSYVVGYQGHALGYIVNVIKYNLAVKVIILSETRLRVIVFFFHDRFSHYALYT